MKYFILALVTCFAISACSTTPLGGPDIAPICKEGFVNGLPGCYKPG